MRKTLFALLLLVLVSSVALAQTTERWLHVRVDNTGEKGEQVRVNVPLSLAEAILPTIHVNKLRNGKIKLSDVHIHDVDVRALLAAVRNSSDGEFVTVESDRESVRVAKSKGYLLVEVREKRKDGDMHTVDIRIPFTVVEALLSGGKDELDILAAIRALRDHGDVELIRVTDGTETVHVSFPITLVLSIAKELESAAPPAETPAESKP